MSTSDIGPELGKKEPGRVKAAGGKKESATISTTTLEGNGQASMPSEAKLVEMAREAAAPVADLLNRKTNQDPAFDAFNFSAEAMVVDQSYQDGEFDTTVGDTPVGKPGKQEWFQVHPDPTYCRSSVCILEDRGPSDSRNDIYHRPSLGHP